MVVNETLILIDVIALLVGVFSILLLRSYHYTHRLGDVMKKALDLMIYGIMLLIASAAYTIIAVYENFASIENILSVQTVLMFIGFLFFITAAYKITKIAE